MRAAVGRAGSHASAGAQHVQVRSPSKLERVVICFGEVTRPFDPAAIISGLGDELPVGIWVARAPGGEFIYANREFQEIMGMVARPDVAVGGYSAPYGIHDLEGG